MAARRETPVDIVWLGGISASQLETVVCKRHPERGELRAPASLASVYEFSGGEAGAGSFGVCRFGRHRSSGTPCVVKEIARTDAPREYMYEMMELNTFGVLLQPPKPHPHVMHYLDFFLGSDAVIVTMPPLDGPELFDYIVEHAPLTEACCRDLTAQALSGLAHIHDLRIIHRDVKLESFRFRSKSAHDELVLFDFSLACGCTDESREPCGTVPYVAPEVLTRHITTKVDLWSFGVALYVMLSGREPFPKLTREACGND